MGVVVAKRGSAMLDSGGHGEEPSVQAGEYNVEATDEVPVCLYEVGRLACSLAGHGTIEEIGYSKTVLKQRSIEHCTTVQQCMRVLASAGLRPGMSCILHWAETKLFGDEFARAR